MESEDAGRIVCGREALRILPGGRSILAREGGESHRLVVLKPLPPDCLDGPLPPLLHEHVHDRLSRVRELADVRVASLHGVEVDPRLGPLLVWQYIEGEDLPTAIRPEGLLGRRSSLEIARDVVTAVERLHLLGLVHGALHLRNIIVRPRIASLPLPSSSARPDALPSTSTEIVLTHISPLVIDDPRRDIADLRRMLRELNGAPLAHSPQRPATSDTPRNSPGHGASAILARVLAEWNDDTDLTSLREKMLMLDGPQFIQGRPPPPRRNRSLIAALLTAFLGLLLTGAVLFWVTR
jgi:hypothetical protein